MSGQNPLPQINISLYSKPLEDTHKDLTQLPNVNATAHVVVLAKLEAEFDSNGLDDKH